MNFKADPKQRLIVLSMVFGETPDERAPTFTALGKRKLTPALREQLVDAGVCQVEKRGRTMHMLLGSQAPQFVQQTLGETLAPSPVAARVLSRVLAALKPLMDRGALSLDQLLGQAALPVAAPPAIEPRADDRMATEQEVRDVCLSLAGGQVGKRVRLAALRERLLASRDSLDQTLKSMQQAGRLVLYKLDNPAEITPDDERAALVIAGHPRHLVYLEA